MLQAIAREPALAGLATRESDDYAITLLELFAAVGDVLTFYSERYVNELYLGTARERDSILRMVRLIGYQLRPGLAATTMLDFTLDDDALTRIRKGLKVMSVPGQDERAQTFETIEAMAADARLNALDVFAPPVLFNAFHQGRAEAPVTARPDPLGPGDRFVVFGLSRIEEKTVAGLDLRPDGEHLRFAPPIQGANLWVEVARAAKRRRRLRFFGHDAPDSHQRYNDDHTVPPQNRWQSVPIPHTFAENVTSYPLDTRYDDLKPGAQLLIDAGPSAAPRLRTALVVNTEDLPATQGAVTDTVTHATLRQTLRDRPAAVALGGGARRVFARSGAGHVLRIDPAATSRWSDFGGFVATADLSAVATGPAQIDLFTRDGLGHLRHAAWNGGAWGAFADRGGILTTGPAALAVGGEVFVFVRGLDLGLWYLRITGGAAGAWTARGGILTSPPVPVTSGGTTIDVFVRGLGRGLWRQHWTGAAWSEWEPLAGTLATAPAAASTGAGRLDVVALDDDGALIHRRTTGGDWTEWATLGGAAEGTPAILATGPDRVDVFVRRPNGELWQIARTGAAWSSWVSLGGSLASSPTVVLSGGTLRVFARGADGTLVTRARTGSVWSGWSALGDGLGAIPDRRATRIYEIETPDIEFRGYDYPREISAGRVVARLAAAPGLGALDKGRRILLDDGASEHLARVTATRLVSSELGAAPDHLAVDFEPALPAPLGAAVLRGNIAEASHGETQPEEPLGHGDAAKAFQRFTLSRKDLTYLPSETSLAGEAELEMRVNGELWHEVPSLFARAPGERAYTARRTDEGETVVTFGDGRTGARVPSGAMNVVARYRTGIGLEGRVKADQLSILLERPVGLRAVTNPLPATGAADPETRDDARAAAPTRVRTFGRAVSEADFAWLAESSGLVKRAHATWVWRRLEKTLHLTVAGEDGARLTEGELATLESALDAARDPNRPLLLANLVRVPLVVRAKLLRDSAFKADDVEATARAAIEAHFAFEAMPLGQAVHASAIYAVLQGARGVVAVDLDLFHLKDHADLSADERAVRAVTADPVQAHIRIFPARPTPGDPADIDRYARAGFDGPMPPPVLAAEQAYVADPAGDIVLTVMESL